jgi:putative glutamine amidotransferase
LAKRKWLNVPNLQIVGIYFEDEYEDYFDANVLVLKKKNKWIRLEKISCKLTAQTIFQKNECSAEFARLFISSQAIIFTGGPDIPPAFYGEETRLTTVIADPPRHMFELSFLFHLLVGDHKAAQKPLLASRPDYIILGICLGMQSMHVATGGTLIQDIPSELYGAKSIEAVNRLAADKIHRNYWAPLDPASSIGWAAVHPIKLVGDFEVTKALAQKNHIIKVISIHHQAIEPPLNDFNIFATSIDGKVIEGIQHKTYPNVIGIQFHTEKVQLLDAKVEYRQKTSNDSKTTNYVAAWYARDDNAQRFFRNFWKYFSKILSRSI